MRWLRKAILRAAGVLALHDENKAFAEERALMLNAGAPRPGFDGTAFGAAFHICLIEGSEVVFIVVAVGAGGTGFLLAAGLGAFAALLIVAALGLALHRPLARVPENTLKFIVGVILSGFGVFWLGEGMGLRWPDGDVSILALVAGFGLVGRAPRPSAGRGASRPPRYGP